MPTLYLWKRYLRVNHTSTLSCNCEYSHMCGFVWSVFVWCVFQTPYLHYLPHTACHMLLIALCNTLACAWTRTHKYTCKQTLYYAYSWVPVGSSPSHLQPVSLPPTSEMSERASKTENSGSWTQLTERLLKISIIYVLITVICKSET